MKKNVIYIGLAVILLLSMLSGCGRDESASQNVNSEIEQKDSGEGKDALSKRAKKEGVSVSEMEQMIEELTKMTAETYGFTAEEYKASLLEDGKTPFDEFVIAADYMGITIKEYYEYEKQKTTLSAEDQEIIDAMKQVTSQESADGHKADSSISSEDLAAFIKFEVYELLSEEVDKEEGYYSVEYTSELGVADLVNHFKEVLEGSEGYSIMDSTPVGALLSGKLGDQKIDIFTEYDFENKMTIVRAITVVL